MSECDRVLSSSSIVPMEGGNRFRQELRSEDRVLKSEIGDLDVWEPCLCLVIEEVDIMERLYNTTPLEV